MLEQLRTVSLSIIISYFENESKKHNQTRDY